MPPINITLSNPTPEQFERIMTWLEREQAIYDENAARKQEMLAKGIALAQEAYTSYLQSLGVKPFAS